jgi:hypothetical protein
MDSLKRENNLTIVKYTQIRTRMEVKARKKTFMVRKVRRRRMRTKRGPRKAIRIRNPLLNNLLRVRSLINLLRTI